MLTVLIGTCDKTEYNKQNANKSWMGRNVRAIAIVYIQRRQYKIWGVEHDTQNPDITRSIVSSKDKRRWQMKQ